MAADEKVTWGEVCKKVGFRDNLYQTCRDKVEDYQAGGFANGAFDEAPEPDFTRKLVKSAVPIPKPPALDDASEFEDAYEDDDDEPEGFFDAFPVKKLLIYGGVAAVVTFLLLRKNTPAAAPKTVAVSSSEPATSQAA